MKSLHNFIIKPNGERYNNTKKIGDKEYEEFLQKEGLKPNFEIVNATHDLYLKQGYDEDTMERIMNQNFAVHRFQYYCLY